MLNLRETICFFFFSLVFHFLASPFLAFLIYRWSLCLSTHLLIRWHEYHILEGFWFWKTFQCSNFKLLESWSNLLSCLRRRFYSIISFDLVMRNLNFRISEFQSCFSKASGIWAILQSRGRSWKKIWYYSGTVITSNFRKILREFREKILSLFDGQEVVWRKSQRVRCIWKH